MQLIDRFFLSFIFYTIFPITLFLFGWWGSLIFTQSPIVFIFALIGLIIGIIIDIIFVSRHISTGYRISPLTQITILVFYSICFFGFFMGVPVFNFFLGVPVGFFTSRKIKFQPVSVQKTSLITAIVMFFICFASGFIALNDPFTAANLKGMLNLPFIVTTPILLTIIFVGGIFLVVGEYFLVKLVVKVNKAV